MPVLGGDDLVDLARRLRAADTGGWREDGVGRLVAGLGWERAGDVVRTGLPSGDARLRPVGKYESDHVRGEEYVGLYVPIAVAADPAVKADAFRRAAHELTAALGPSPIMGSYGGLSTFYDSTPRWGAPFRRWRGHPDSLELQAGEAGPELVLFPTDPTENWFWRQRHGEAYALDGFFGTDRSAANGGLSIPGMWRTDDWEVFHTTLTCFLRSLPAEVRALGIELSLAMHALIPGTYGPWVFHLACDADTLELAVFEQEDVDLAKYDLPSLGWTATADAPPSHEHDEFTRVAYHSGPHRLGEVDGLRLAGLLVETAKAFGIESPQGLSLVDHAQSIDGYHVDFFGLTLRENP
ncbi:hypothetical protein [Actinomadura macrotermitis]|uniref:Uncharacterized protein n=1 Tax=Actinomadura macrotermitis TaxID=2585200 RepID=A0A7K0BUY1_9ACTN|nr:hypothetical protein [Actinomadura macrotermitis]MQY04971.1 hypothetical protein [Actinomadura macrotermitis]